MNAARACFHALQPKQRELYDMTYRDSLTSEGVFYSRSYVVMHLRTHAFALKKWNYVIRHAYLQSIYTPYKPEDHYQLLLFTCTLYTELCRCFVS